MLQAGRSRVRTPMRSLNISPSSRIMTPGAYSVSTTRYFWGKSALDSLTPRQHDDSISLFSSFQNKERRLQITVFSVSQSTQNFWILAKIIYS
jgi:hypothetical protein